MFDSGLSARVLVKLMIFGATCVYGVRRAHWANGPSREVVRLHFFEWEMKFNLMDGWDVVDGDGDYCCCWSSDELDVWRFV